MAPRWPQENAPTPREAMALQEQWRRQVVRERTFGRVERIGGVDISIRGDRARAAVCVLSWPKLELLEVATAVEDVVFPYVPGLLGFREVPTIQRAWERLRCLPDVALVDGHGLAHPRRFGVATHVGFVLDVPTIGCGKTRLVGEHREPAQRRGARTVLRHQGETIGKVLRTRVGVAPVYVSIGHRVDLRTAVSLVLRSARRYRLPEPIREAHKAAGGSIEEA